MKPTCLAVVFALLLITGCKRDAPAETAAAPAEGQPATTPAPEAKTPQQPATSSPPAATPKSDATSQSAAAPQQRPNPGARFEAGSGAASQPAQPARPASVTVPEGTSLRVRTDSTLSTKTAQEGQTFSATLAQALVVDGVTVAPRGARVTGRVTESDAGGRVQGRARLTVALTSLETSRGSVALDTGSFVQAARSTKKKDAAKVGIGAGIGAAIGAIAGGGKGAAVGAAAGGGAGTGAVLATRGEAAEIPAETLLTFKLQAPVKVAR
jgi:hypothetical protein